MLASLVSGQSRVTWVAQTQMFLLPQLISADLCVHVISELERVGTGHS